MSRQPATAPRPLSRKRFDRVYTTLRDRICLLEYAPNTRLSEAEVAAEFGVSRTPIRRVLSRLESEGLVESRHGVGTFVTDVDLATLEQAYAFRMELAVLIGRLDPLPRDTADLARMRALLVRCDELAKQPEAKTYARLNMDFFQELSALTGNLPLREVNRRLYFQTTRIWLMAVPHLNLADEVAMFRREIADVLAAMEVGDLEAVGHIRRGHISMSVARLRHYASGTLR